MREWRAIRNQVIYHLQDEMGLTPGEIVQLRIIDLCPDGNPLKKTEILNGYVRLKVSQRFQYELRQLYPQSLLIADYPLTQKIITNRPYGRPLTAGYVGRLLKTEKRNPF